jgi:hypothetical protein
VNLLQAHEVTHREPAEEGVVNRSGRQAAASAWNAAEAAVRRPRLWAGPAGVAS